MFVLYNENPHGNRVGDCVIRSIAKLLEQDWNRTYIDIMLEGYALKDMPSSNFVWASYLKHNGFEREAIPNTCPVCYSIKQFCKDHPEGRYLLATGSHVVAVINGDYYDTWDSGDEVPMYYFERKR